MRMTLVSCCFLLFFVGTLAISRAWIEERSACHQMHCVSRLSACAPDPVMSKSAIVNESRLENDDDGTHHRTSVLFCGSTKWNVMGRAKVPKFVVERGGSDAGRLVLGPELIPELENKQISKVVTGNVAAHILAISSAGVVYGWGRNDSGQLALSDRVSRATPSPIDDLREHVVIDAALGRNHTLVLTRDHQVLAFGSNQSGQLGLGSLSRADTSAPESVVLSSLAGSKPVGLAAGGDFSIIRDDKGMLYSFGMPEYGQLGHNSDGKYLVKSSKIEWQYEAAPRKIASLAQQNVFIVDVKCGVSSSVALDSNGDVWTWGWGSYGRLGHSSPKDEYCPRKIDKLGYGRGIRSIFAGASACYAISNSGQVFMWGQTKRTGEANMYPKPVYDLQGWNIRSISCGPTSTVVAADQSVISWGPSPSYGELGYGENDPQKSSTKPKLIDALEGAHVMSAHMGLAFCAMIVRRETEEDEKIISTLPVLKDQHFSNPETAGGADDNDNDNDDDDDDGSSTKHVKRGRKRKAPAQNTKAKQTRKRR